MTNWKSVLKLDRSWEKCKEYMVTILIEILSEKNIFWIGRSAVILIHMQISVELSASRGSKKEKVSLVKSDFGYCDNSRKKDLFSPPEMKKMDQTDLDIVSLVHLKNKSKRNNCVFSKILTQRKNDLVKKNHPK